MCSLCQVLNGPQQLSCHIFNTHFYKKYVAQGTTAEARYRNVARWTKQLGKCQFWRLGGARS